MCVNVINLDIHNDSAVGNFLKHLKKIQNWTFDASDFYDNL
jgi:hypothetical protein